MTKKFNPSKSRVKYFTETKPYKQWKKSGYPVDFSSIEERMTNDDFAKDHRKSNPSENFLEKTAKATFSKCQDQKTPHEILYEKENEQFEKAVQKWLPQALERLPKNQEACLRLRFNLDQDPTVDGIRTQQEIARIVGFSQQMTYLHIKEGLINLRKDFKKSFKISIKSENIKIFMKNH